MKKILVVMLSALMLTSVLAGCTSKDPSSSSSTAPSSSSSVSSSDVSSSEAVAEVPTHDGKSKGEEINVTVKILDDENIAMYSGAAKAINTEKPTVYDVTYATVEFGASIPYEAADGEFTSFGNLEPTDSFGWNLYLNGEKVATKSNQTPIKEGDVIEWKMEKKA